MTNPPSRIATSLMALLAGLPLTAFGSDGATRVNQQAAPKRYALLIAVKDYSHAEMNRPRLQYPEKDAEAIGELLESHGYEVDYLLGRDATQEAIREKLSSLGGKANDSGVAIVGVWGHGVQFTNTNEPLFCPYDTRIRPVSRNGQPLFARDGKTPLVEPDPDSLITMTEVVSGLRVCGAGSSVVFADCCRESPNRPRGRAFGEGVQSTSLHRNTAAIFACDVGERAFEDDRWRHGALTKALLEILPGQIRNGKTPVTAFLAPLRKRVQELVSDASGNRDKQTVHWVLRGGPDLKLAAGSDPPPPEPDRGWKQRVGSWVGRYIPIQVEQDVQGQRKAFYRDIVLERFAAGRFVGKVLFMQEPCGTVTVEPAAGGLRVTITPQFEGVDLGGTFDILDSDRLQPGSKPHKTFSGLYQTNAALNGVPIFHGKNGSDTVTLMELPAGKTLLISLVHREQARSIWQWFNRRLFVLPEIENGRRVVAPIVAHDYLEATIRSQCVTGPARLSGTLAMPTNIDPASVRHRMSQIHGVVIKLDGERAFGPTQLLAHKSKTVPVDLRIPEGTGKVSFEYTFWNNGALGQGNGGYLAVWATFVLTHEP